MEALILAFALANIGTTASAQDRGGYDRWKSGSVGGRYDGRGDREGRYNDPEDRPDRRLRRRGDRSIRTFGTPQLGGYALDHCPRDVGLDGLLRGRCGLPVATEFCQRRGFAEAVDAPTRQGLGATRFIRTGEIVDHPWATGFRYITCER